MQLPCLSVCDVPVGVSRARGSGMRNSIGYWGGVGMGISTNGAPLVLPFSLPYSLHFPPNSCLIIFPLYSLFASPCRLCSAGAGRAPLVSVTSEGSLGFGIREVPQVVESAHRSPGMFFPPFAVPPFLCWLLQMFCEVISCIGSARFCVFLLIVGGLNGFPIAGAVSLQQPHAVQ